MARPTKYGEPLSRIVKIRLTDTEHTRLDDARGTTSVSEYLRTLIRSHLHLGLADDQTTHRHTPGDWVAERTVKGVTTNTYKCSHPGCTHLLERKGRQ
jgi:hypothetical protein